MSADKKERPILFSGEMVRAILSGRKSQTRRVVKPQPINSRVGMCNMAYCGHPNEWCVEGSVSEYTVANPRNPNAPELPPKWKCPYGKVGDRLWVKETFSVLPSGQLWYRADGHSVNDGYWKPSIFMRREYSRITLEIVSVRVGRLQEISEADARAEGCFQGLWKPCGLAGAYKNNDPIATYIAGYAQLWESINGAGSWSANPWVWVIEFKRVEK